MSIYWYYSPFIKLFWTKRYMNNYPSGIRSKLKRLKRENRLNKRDNNFLMIENIWNARKPYCPYKPQRRNYNEAYRCMQIPA